MGKRSILCQLHWSLCNLGGILLLCCCSLGEMVHSQRGEVRRMSPDSGVSWTAFSLHYDASIQLWSGRLSHSFDSIESRQLSSLYGMSPLSVYITLITFLVNLAHTIFFVDELKPQVSRLFPGHPVIQMSYTSVPITITFGVVPGVWDSRGSTLFESKKRMLWNTLW